MSADLECTFCHLPMRPTRVSRTSDTKQEALYCCYGCAFAASVTQSSGEQGQATWMLTRLGISIFLSMGVMVFSLVMYGHDIYGIDLAKSAPLATSLTGLMRYISLILATPVFLLLGLPILSNALTQIRFGIASTDMLVVVGVAAAYIYSYVSTLTDSGAVYYETACMVLVLMTLGRYLEATGKLKASESIESLARLLPDTVTVDRGGSVETVSAGDVEVADVVIVAAGECIAVDGIIESGQAHVDERLLTGESAPVTRQAGDEVHAGTTALDGSLTIRATAVGLNHAVGRLGAVLEAAKRAKGRYERLADRVAGFFIPATLVAAAIAGICGFSRGGLDEAIMTTLATLLIACPCALGIATPMAVWVGLGHSASAGVLFRNGETIEALARVRAVAFDKTGTLTVGAPVVSSFKTDPPDDTRHRHVLETACGLALGSTHLLSKSLSHFGQQQDISPHRIPSTKTIPGRGVVASLDGIVVRLGNRAMMSEASVRFSVVLSKEAKRIESAGEGIVCVALGEVVAGVFGFSERLRDETKTAMAKLDRLRVSTCVLTGDHGQRGAAIAQKLGVETHAELTPEQKIEHVQRIRQDAGVVAMVGDGLNDAPALAAADVGIAMGCGADVTRESAAVCLLGDDLCSVPWAIELARRCVWTIKLNLFWAFFYNVIGMALAIAGKLNPIIAAGAMVVSSLFVVTNSLRLSNTPTQALSSPVGTEEGSPRRKPWVTTRPD